MNDRSAYWTASLLLLAALLIGFAQAALLPPWEGFDEIAHYSYVQQLAETGRWPRHGDRTSREGEDYLKAAPSARSLSPAWSYERFATAPSDVVASVRALIHEPPQQPRTWRPGEGRNWQAQHPPLYYLLMTPAYLVSKSWTLANQLLLMRGISYLIALAGLCVALMVAARGRADDPAPRAALFLAIGLWPFIFPMWFAQMGRITNDCLLVLIVACAWPVTQRALSSRAALRDFVLLGLLVGLAMLTKATFVPFAGVLGLLLAVHAWRQPDRPTAIGRLAVLGVVSVAVCGWWYAMKTVETGSLIGSNDAVLLQEAGGLIKGLSQHATFEKIIKFPWVIGATFLWGGTWSFVAPPRAALLPLFAGVLVLAAGYIVSRRGTHTLADRMPLFTLIAMLIGLAYQSLVLISIGLTVMPGWYLHAFAPLFASLVALGLAGANTMRPLRWAAALVVLYPLVFLPLAAMVEVFLFAGCGTEQVSGTYYPASQLIGCASHASELLGRIAVLSHPGFAVVSFIAGWGVAAVALALAAKQLISTRPA